MAPTFGPEDDVEELGFRTQTICAHVLQSVGTREQISLLEHGGHVGDSSGHCTQRLKMVRRVRSTSEVMLVGCWYIGMPPSAVPYDMLVDAIVTAASQPRMSSLDVQIWSCSMAVVHGCRRILPFVQSPAVVMVVDGVQLTSSSSQSTRILLILFLLLLPPPPRVSMNMRGFDM